MRRVTDNDSQPIEGEIVGPEGDGQWLSVPAATRLTGTPQKTLYRRVEKHQIPSRKNAEGRIEVWIATATATEQRLSPIVAVDTVEVREILAPLAEALRDSQRQSEGNLARAVAAEAEVARLQERLSRSRTGRIDALRSWWRFWILGETDDKL